MVAYGIRVGDAPNQGCIKYKFAAVYSNDPEHENKVFWDATPNISFEMTVRNEAAQLFEPGIEYYMDFTPA